MSRTRWITVAATVTLALAAAYPMAGFADKLSQVKQQLQQQQEKKKETQAKINSLTQQEQSLRAQISDIQNQIAGLQRSIVSTQADIQARQRKIRALKQEIARTQVKIKAQYNVLLHRVRLMYEAGNTSYLSVLFSATSFADLLNRLQLLSMIAEQDQKLLKEIQATKHALDARTNQVEVEQARQRQVFARLIDEQQQAQEKQSQENTLLQQVQDEKIKEEADLKSESDAMQNLQAQIQQLESTEGQYTGASDGWTWPVPGHYDISSPYGWRTWSDGRKEFHNGIDIPAPIGTPIVAATGGKVLYAGPASGFGDWIVIESAGGLLEIYGHMYSWEIAVAPGQIVAKGQRIAAVGSNGLSTGPHLHFTIATGFDSSGYPVSTDPTKYVGH